MAKKQSDYLTDLLMDKSGAPIEAESIVDAAFSSAAPRPYRTSRTGMSLLSRESALARVASGEVRQVTQLQLDPARVRVWTGNARMQSRLSEESVRDLIDSILAEGGQKVPAIVRRVQDDLHHNYEVIAGTRRHFAISWLRANNYPEMKLLVQVVDMDDEAAFRLADIENRARKDVSDFERARNYAAALDAHYGGKQRRMAERLHVHESWLSRMLKVASLPDTVVEAFGSLHDIQMKSAYPLAQFCTDSDKRAMAMKRARKLRDVQDDRRAKGMLPLAAPDLIRQIMLGTDDERGPPSPAPYSANSRHGRVMLSLLSRNRQGLTVRLHSGSGATADDLAEALRHMLAALGAEGKGLNP